MKQRINLDLDRELWKKVSIKAVELDIQKRELVELALKEFLENNK